MRQAIVQRTSPILVATFSFRQISNALRSLLLAPVVRKRYPEWRQIVTTVPLVGRVIGNTAAHASTRPSSESGPPVPQAGGRRTQAAARTKKPVPKVPIVQAPVREAHCPRERRSQCIAQESPAFVPVQNVTPNPSIERTSTGRPHLAFISFWAKCVLPVPAAHVKR